MSERLTLEEIAVMRTADKSWAVGDDVLRAVAYMLHLHDLVERLRNLQQQDITDEQRMEWLGSPWLFTDRTEMHCDMIAAAVRVIVASLDKPADTA